MRNPFAFKRADPVKPKTLTPAMIWDAPVDYNRAMRRSVGLFGRIWKWNPQPNSGAGGRYVRRHYAAGTPTTRRERRHRARIARIVRKGM